VKRVDAAGGGADDQDGIVEDVKADVVTGFRYVLDAPRLQPDLAPQQVALGARVFFRDVGLHREGHGAFKRVDGIDYFAFVTHSMSSPGRGYRQSSVKRASRSRSHSAFK